MIHLTAVMNYMLNNLGYSQKEVADIFMAMEAGEYAPEALLEDLGLESSSSVLIARVTACAPKWRLALNDTIILRK